MYIRLVKINKKEDENGLRKMLKSKFIMKYVRTDIQFSLIGIRGLTDILSKPYLKLSIQGIHSHAKDIHIIDKSKFTKKCVQNTEFEDIEKYK